MSDVNLSIRAYEAPDLARLAEIWFEASRRAHAFLGETRLRAQKTLIEEIYLPHSETWVACREGEPVGFIGLIDTLVGGLFVDPALQGNGIGRALVAHARERKGELLLDVYADNLGARAFYERLGFREMSRRAEDDEGLPFENIRMRLGA